LEHKVTITDDQDEKITKILAPLKDTYKLFVQHYCRFLSKTAAAKHAGYSEHTASQAGHNIYNRTEVREAIVAIFKATAFDPDDNIAGIKRMAEINTSDYFKWVETWITVRRRIPIQQYIDQLAHELKLEDMCFMDSDEATMFEKTEMIQNIRSLTRRLKKLRKEQKLNPKAQKFVDVDELHREKVLDIDKDNVPIKAIKHKENGTEVELYSAADARVSLARIAGSFEKDNAQKPQPIFTAPTVNVYNGSAPPMAEDEKQIDLSREDV
jgi:hypothetical protein